MLGTVSVGSMGNLLNSELGMLSKWGAKSLFWAQDSLYSSEWQCDSPGFIKLKPWVSKLLSTFFFLLLLLLSLAQSNFANGWQCENSSGCLFWYWLSVLWDLLLCSLRLCAATGHPDPRWVNHFSPRQSCRGHSCSNGDGENAVRVLARNRWIWF